MVGENGGLLTAAEVFVYMVRWSQGMEYLKDQGVDHYMELGPGRVLTGLHKRIDRRAVVTNVSTPEALRACAS